MANLRMTLLDMLNKDEQGADPSFLRDGVRLLAQELMDAEVTQLAGVGLHERSENRLSYRGPRSERMLLPSTSAVGRRPDRPLQPLP
jgi:transposase-like protein